MIRDEQARILIIDDEPTIVKGCTLSLHEEGYIVESRHNGTSGLAEALAGDYDLVLLDMKLPDIGGMEILARLNAECKDIPVIDMTGYSTVENAVEAMKTGAFDYIAKPFSEDELILSTAKALELRRLKTENSMLRRQLFEAFRLQ